MQTQSYGFCRFDDSLLLKTRLLVCIKAISRWMASNRLRLNPAKSEFVWSATSRRIHHIDDFVFDLPDGAVATSTSVWNLGAYLDQAMTIHEHVARIVSACFYQLRCMPSIRRSIPTSTAIQLVNSFIISRVDYCNSLLSRASSCLTDRVQSILNAAACLFYGRGRYDRVTDLIRDRFHWLPVCQRMRFKCGLLAYKGLHGFAHPTSQVTASGRTRPRTDTLYEYQHPRVTSWSCRTPKLSSESVRSRCCFKGLELIAKNCQECRVCRNV